MAQELTQKQDDFCLKVIEIGNASEAYRQVYNAENMKPETVHRKAAELMENGKIAARLAELRENHQQRHGLTVDDLVIELEDTRKIAIENGHSSAAVTATMGKAKLLGFDKHIVKLELQEQEEEGDVIDFDSLTDSELRELKALIDKAGSKPIKVFSIIYNGHKYTRKAED